MLWLDLEKMSIKAENRDYKSYEELNFDIQVVGKQMIETYTCKKSEFYSTYISIWDIDMQKEI